MFQKLFFAVLVTAVAVSQAQAQRVVYDPQEYTATAVQGPYYNGMVGGDVTVIAQGSNAVVMANGLAHRAVQSNDLALQLAVQAQMAQQPRYTVVQVPTSCCSPRYAAVYVQAPPPPQPVVVHRQAPQLPPPPAPNMFVFPAGPTVITPPGVTIGGQTTTVGGQGQAQYSAPPSSWNYNAPVQVSPPAYQIQGGQTSQNWNSPSQQGGAVRQGQGGQNQGQGVHPPRPRRQRNQQQQPPQIGGPAT